MKHLLLTALMAIAITPIFANTYYSQGSLAANSLSSWNSNRSGGGTTPASFTVAGDIFVIQAGHTLTVSAAWTVGGAGSILKIESTGVLLGNNAVDITGTFQLENNARYIHNNAAEAVTNGIFSGTESFAPNASVEIQNWSSNTVALPDDITWGNLVINYTGAIGTGDWNQSGNLSLIQGNFIIENTGLAGRKFVLTGNTDLNLLIGGNLDVQNGILLVKSADDVGTLSSVQVDGSVMVSGGELNLGVVDFLPNNELSFKKDLSISGTGSIASENEFEFLVANGNTTQSFSSTTPLDCSFKIMPNATISLNSDLSLGTNMYFVIAGICNAGTHSITLDNGQLFIASGTLNASSVINMNSGSCRVCSGDGIFSGPSQFCNGNGTKGKFNFSSGGFMSFNRSGGSIFMIGDAGAPGEVSLTGSSGISFTGLDEGGVGSVELGQNSVLSFDESSYIDGSAFYSGNGGLLIIGSPDGITETDLTGNIRVDGSRNYDNLNDNSFEYNSTDVQSTGNGLPLTIDGSLTINAAASNPVQLTRPVTIAPSGTLNLENGILQTSGAVKVTLSEGATMVGGSSSSYVDGPLSKIGNTDFTFHIGKSGIYAPVSMHDNGAGLVTDEFEAEYVPADPSTTYIGNIYEMDHISSLEYWNINQIQGAGPTKTVTLAIGAGSAVSDFASLVVAYFLDDSWLNYDKVATSGTTSNGTISFVTSAYGPFTLGTTSSLNALPVQLLGFNAVLQNGKGILSWEISREEEPAYFEVLASQNNRDFKAIAKVNGGNGQQYGYTDSKLHPGTNYYRLRIVEKDGNSVLSRIVALFNNTDGFALLSANPSVTAGDTYLNISSSSSDQIRLVFSNASGQVMKTLSVNVHEGSNNIGVNISSLPAGIYTVTAINRAARVASIRLIRN